MNSESDQPSSVLHISFASPGSAHIIAIHQEGIVTPFQILGLSEYLKHIAIKQIEEGERLADERMRMTQQLIRKP